MKRGLTGQGEMITIDIAQPGTSELISILRKYDDFTIMPHTGNSNRVSITQKKQKTTAGKTLSKGIKGFTLGKKKNGGVDLYARQSCAVTKK